MQHLLGEALGEVLLLVNGCLDVCPRTMAFKRHVVGRGTVVRDSLGRLSLRVLVAKRSSVLLLVLNKLAALTGDTLLWGVVSERHFECMV